MWDRAVDGRILRFHLGGVNNQNLLLVDEETGSWWQQITGECLFGPLKGKQLNISVGLDRVSSPAYSGIPQLKSLAEIQARSIRLDAATERAPTR